MQLTLRTKIILLPALAGVVGLLMLGAALVFGRRSQRELATLEQGHYAALEELPLPRPFPASGVGRTYDYPPPHRHEAAP